MSSQSLIHWNDERADALDEIEFWAEVYSLHAGNERRRELLRTLVDWRNAIAHQDFAQVVAGGPATLHLATVRRWRTAVNSLARHFDEVMYNYLVNLTGSNPW